MRNAEDMLRDMFLPCSILARPGDTCYTQGHLSDQILLTMMAFNPILRM